jgi:hypothetical protein
MFRTPHPYLLTQSLEVEEGVHKHYFICFLSMFLCDCLVVLVPPCLPLPTPGNAVAYPSCLWLALVVIPQIFSLINISQFEVTVMLRWTTAENITLVICRSSIASCQSI